MTVKVAEILARFEQLKTDWDELFNGDFSIREVFRVLDSLVELAEGFDGLDGQAKHRLVRDAISELDRQYNLVARVDMSIKLPWLLELVDGPLIRGAIDVLISYAAHALGWRRVSEEAAEPENKQKQKPKQKQAAGKKKKG